MLTETTRPLTVAKTPVDPKAAVEIIAGYCFGEEALIPKTPPIGAVGLRLSTRHVAAFAYRTYDCIAPSPTNTLDPIDVLVANGLNARMQSSTIGAVIAVGDEISTVLKEIPATQTFWDLPRNEIMSAPDERSGPAWHLWRAWTILMSLHGVGIATTHKILHHKRPNFFPLIDNQTRPRLAETSWLTIHCDLNGNPAGWQELESQIAKLAKGRGGVALTRLRLHDILLWTRVTGSDETARRLGRGLAQVDH